MSPSRSSEGCAASRRVLDGAREPGEAHGDPLADRRERNRDDRDEREDQGVFGQRLALFTANPAPSGRPGCGVRVGHGWSFRKADAARVSRGEAASPGSGSPVYAPPIAFAIAWSCAATLTPRAVSAAMLTTSMSARISAYSTSAWPSSERSSSMRAKLLLAQMASFSSIRLTSPLCFAMSPREAANRLRAPLCLWFRPGLPLPERPKVRTRPTLWLG